MRVTRANSSRLGDGQTQLQCRPAKKRRVVKNDAKKKISPVKTVTNCKDYDLKHMARNVRESLQTAPPLNDKILCRQEEQDTIEKFLVKHLTSMKGGSLYCVGCPGTGKTITLQSVVKRLPIFQRSRTVSCSFINAMSLNTARMVYHRLCEEIYGERCKNSESSRAKLNALFMSRGKRTRMHVVIIDEMDGLLSKTQEVLYELFEWASRLGSTLILIGIANALEMTNRFLPRLSGSGSAPQLLTFSAYSCTDLSQIIVQRLQSQQQNNTSIEFDENAIQLLARKIAACTGDARKFLELSRKALDAAVKKSLETQDNHTRVNIRNVSNVLKSCFDSPQISTIQTLPQHQQIVLCVASQLMHGKNSKPICVGDFHLHYCRISRKQVLPSVSSGDFSDIISAIVCQGLMESTTACVKGHRARLLSMRVQRRDIEFALNSQDFFSSLLVASG